MTSRAGDELKSSQGDMEIDGTRACNCGEGEPKLEGCGEPLRKA